MELDVKENEVVDAKYEPYVADSLDCVKLKFVDSDANVENAESYPVGFAYQQFGESERIVGYKNLIVNVVYSDLTMYSYVEIKHNGLIAEIDKLIEPDDIPELIRKQYPKDQTKSLSTNYHLFKSICTRQNEYSPYGSKIDQFDCNKKSYDLYRVDFKDRRQGFDQFLSRAQTLALYFIESASYTDPEDTRFSHYFVYEKTDNLLKLAGFVVVYRFYAHPDKERVRFAQVLVLPPYRRSGFGGKFIEAVFKNLREDPKVLDITAETPADHFIYLRDYLDCIFCKDLDMLSHKNIVNGYTKDLEKNILHHSKIGKVQARRVYEILRYYYLQTVNTHDEDAFETEVKKRLDLPFQKTQRESKKLKHAFNDQELAIVSQKDDPEERKKILNGMYDETLRGYDVVLDRLNRFRPDIFPSPQY